MCSGACPKDFRVIGYTMLNPAGVDGTNILNFGRGPPTWFRTVTLYANILKIVKVSAVISRGIFPEIIGLCLDEK